MTSFIVYIGHGRALEAYLGFFKVLLAASIALSSISARTPALADFAWYYSSFVLALPFAVVGLLQLTGLWLNIWGKEWSWILRFSGASTAMFVWVALLIKTSWLGEPSLIYPIALSCLPASAFLVYKAWNRLPVPGAVGLV